MFTKIKNFRCIKPNTVAGKKLDATANKRILEISLWYDS
jgi:hypothetical protein